MQPPPSFDTWTAGFLIAVAMGLFLFVLLLSTKHRKTYPIAFFVLAFSIILLQYVLYWTGYQYVFPYLVMLPPMCYYLTGPLLYWYFLNLYQRKVPKSFAFHFIPAGIIFCMYLVVLARNTFGFEYNTPLFRLAGNAWLLAAHMAIYLVTIRFLTIKPRDTLSEYKKIRSNWANVLTWLYGTFIFAYVSYYILVNFEFFNDEWDYAISIAMSLSIYTIGYFIFKQPDVFNGEFFAAVFLPKTTKEATLEDRMFSELYLKITNHMKQHKPYTDNELRLAHLADQLGFSTHILSKVINKKYGDNFNNFVNAYRLHAAESLLQEEKETSVKTVYFDVGFNSKAAFYNAFKQKHQCTPLQYRKQFHLS